ncbi:hypothetical protein TrVFT333_005011 [Trichoderma virens FT-333]|nr:hypothetical protein TrVFT333_005011 [Trichoderma virens FT-333]
MDVQVHAPESSPVARLLAAQVNSALVEKLEELELGEFNYITDIDARRDIFVWLKKFQDDHNIQLGLNAVGFAIIMSSEAGASAMKKSDGDTSLSRIIPSMDREFGEYIGTMFRQFWNEETQRLWHQLSPSYCFNFSAETLIHLGNDLHLLLAEASLALKPLAKMKDGSVLAQVFWLKKSSLKPQEFLTKPHDSVTFEDIMKRAGLENDQEWGPPGQKCILKIKTAMGTIVAPNFELLKFLWDLTRVAAISGAINGADELLNEPEAVDYLLSCEGEGDGESEGESEEYG